MKFFLLILSLLMFFKSEAQKIDQPFFDTARKKYISNLSLTLVDGELISKHEFEAKYLYKNDLAIAFIEGDSIYMKGMGYKKSVLELYYGDDVKKGVIVTFTKKNILNLTGKKMFKYLNQKENLVLSKAYGLPIPLAQNFEFIKSLDLTKIDSISVLPSIKLHKNDERTEVRDFVIVFFSPKYLRKVKDRLHLEAIK